MGLWGGAGVGAQRTGAGRCVPVWALGSHTPQPASWEAELQVWGEGTGPKLNINSRANIGSWDLVVRPPGGIPPGNSGEEGGRSPGGNRWTWWSPGLV